MIYPSPIIASLPFLSSTMSAFRYSLLTHNLVQSQLCAIGAEHWAMRLEYVAMASSLDLWILGRVRWVNVTSSRHKCFHGVRFWGPTLYQSRHDSY
jgi:hypothetical protein